MSDLVKVNYPVLYSDIEQSEVNQLSTIVNALADEVDELNVKLQEIEARYRAITPDLVPLVYDMEQRQAKPPKEEKVKHSKAAKSLWKKLSQYLHPDKAPEHLKEKFAEMFLRAQKAFAQNDSATLKILLDYLLKLKAVSAMASMDNAELLEFRILDDLKASRLKLTHELDSLKTSTMYQILVAHESGDTEKAHFIYKQHLILTYHLLKGTIKQ